MKRANEKTALSAEQALMKAPASEYMSDAQLAFFRRRLLDLHATTLARIQDAKDRMASPPEFNDETDRASWEEQNAISLRILDREQKLLPKIARSLERIRMGEYGYCIETGDPIGIPRLLASYTAEYCTDIKAIRETKEYFYRA